MIDLRSDTLTLPDREMLETALSAELGDDGRVDANGRGEDKSVNKLEDLAAEITGKESALFFPSGTHANTSAILTYCKPGDNVLVDEIQHILITEKVVFDKSIGQLNPVKYRLDKNRQPDMEEIERKIKNNKINLICVENTHNFSGGTCIDLDLLCRIKTVSSENGIPVHMDGARLFNAAVALGVDAKDICRHADSVMFCISKGLGAPVGSLLCGNGSFIKKARTTRKLLGGNMRQAGVLAAPVIYALKKNIERLIEDNENAKYTAGKLNRLKLLNVQKNVQSNIVMIDTGNTGISPEAFCKLCSEKGLMIRPVIGNYVRMVFYNAVTRKDADEVIRILSEIDDSLLQGR